jgi:transcriptional regulator with AAA-type ATPase domain
MMAQVDSRPLLVGTSPRTQQVVQQIQKMGRGRWPVLLLGETGTGKEVVARSIYSANPAGPFVTVDCSSMVGPLMESALFGHAKGSFTGAVASKTGLLEIADHGTAFFDEIGELPLDLQSKLLRVLQEKNSGPSVPIRPVVPISESSPPQIATSQRKSRRAASEATSTTASTSSPSASLPSASARKTSPINRALHRQIRQRT